MKAKAAAGDVDKALVCLVDMQGRLTGKRFCAGHFLEGAHKESHCRNYLLATNLEMAMPDGFASTSRQSGYGGYCDEARSGQAVPCTLAGRDGDGAV